MAQLTAPFAATGSSAWISTNPLARDGRIGGPRRAALRTREREGWQSDAGMASSPGTAAPPAPLGLSSAEAARRLADAGPRPQPKTSRSYWEIVWTNTFTVFNLILAVLLAIVLALGDFRDALFGGVLVFNTLVGIVQEVRAKRTLDRLALLVAPHARTWRDGEVASLAVDEVVPGDVIRLEPGDQAVADGRVLNAQSLAVDESILSGESDEVEKSPGDQVLSGAYCVAGSGDYEVEAVGPDSFAERLAAEARGTRAQLSPLQVDVNRLLWLTVWVMIPLAVVLVVTLAVRRTDFYDAARTTVAALVPIVPEGLVLLTSITFAVAAVRLARLGTLAQRINAIESLASVDTMCMDKTGTLTENRLEVVGLEPIGSGSDGALRDDLGVLAASVGTANGTMLAIRDALPDAAAGRVVAEVPFSSARKWSGVTLERGGTLVLGAPEILVAQGVALPEAARARIAELAAERRRVVLLGRSELALDGGVLPPLEPLGLVVLTEGLRPDAPDTVAYLRRQGVELKIVSGDSPDTVGAVAEAVGVPRAEARISGQDLPDEPEALADAADSHAIFGRITPEQKRSLVQALTARGRYVAMVGDGVNDVLALKEARLALVMGNGSQMAKGVADLVLLTNAFATVPVALREGRSILRNFQRVAKLFMAKSAYSALLLATVGLAPIAFPFLPRHLTVVSTLTIGLPAFILALVPSPGRVRRDGFLASVLAFSARAGVAAAAAIAGAYLLARGPLDLGVTEGQTVAIVTATVLGMAILVEVERGPERRRVRPWVWGMVVFFLVVFTAGLRVPFLRHFFAVVVPSAAGWGAVAAGSALGVGLLLALRLVPPLARLEALGVQPEEDED
jgi:magnesium-transporting ATPase (P-type)